MVTGIHRDAIQAATGDAPTLFLPLLVAVVALLAQRLPIAARPEQLQVSTVRHFVVHHRGFDHMAKLLVHDTQRVCGKELFTSLLPLVPITSRCTASSVVWLRS